MPFTVTVEGFANGEPIPSRYTGEGKDASPRVDWSGEPEGTRGYALVVDDPDAPSGTWNHWLMWDIPAHLHSLVEGWRPGAVGSTGTNDFRRLGYGGPMPPRGHGRHRYYFRLYALDRGMLGLPPGSRRADLDRALQGRILAEAVYMGTYERK